MSYQNSPYQGIDTASKVSASAAKKLRSLGKTFVGRYLGGSYGVTAKEIQDIHNAGLAIFFYYERGAGDVKKGASKGRVQGKDAYEIARNLGIPKGACIYFACDQDASTSSQFAKVEEYLKAAKQQLQGFYLCGIYGSYYVIEQMYMRRACDRFCQTSAWSHNNVSQHNNVFQYEVDVQKKPGTENIRRQVGFGVDSVYIPDFNAAGAWLPGTSVITSGYGNTAYSMIGPLSNSGSGGSSGKVFVPRTVAPLADEKWWRKPDNPCLARYNGTVLPNCFTGSTEIITNQGVISLKKAYNKEIEVPTLDGEWHKATVKYFGVQRLYKVKLIGSTYYCTANHRWYVCTKKGNNFREVTTTELTASMRIPYRMCNTEAHTRVIGVEDTGTYEGVYCVVEPVTHSFTLSGGEITGNCVGYAYGRFAEIMGQWPTNLPHCNAGLWIDKLNGAYKWGKEPKIGAVAVWKKPGQAGHVAIVEYINTDGTIMLSESGYSASWPTRFWTSGPRSGPNWYGAPYVFQGFIYNPATEGNIQVAPFEGGIKYGTRIPEGSPRYSGTYTGDGLMSMSGGDGMMMGGTYYATAPDHPARKFVRTAVSHAGSDGYKWVKETTGVTTKGWSAAMCCAASKECEFKDIIPIGTFSCSALGQDIVKKYGGKYIKGGLQGGTELPQIGDVFAVTTDIRHRTEYSATSVGIVREVLGGDTVLTVEPDRENRIVLFRRRVRDIAWYARPDWTKVGGTEDCKSMFASPLYETSSSRADATLREVAYLTDKGEPSINKSTNISLSAINYTRILSGIYDAAGYSNIVTMSGGGLSASMEGGYSVDGSGIQPTNARLIFEFMTGKGLSAAQAVGFLANIQQESNFSTSAVNRSSGASGICQWLGGRKTAMIRACNGSWQNNLTGQCEYLWSELNGAESKTLTRLKEEVTSNDEAGARKAAEIVVRQFERPGNYGTEVPKRQANASKFWQMVVVMQNSTGSAGASINTQVVTKSGVTLTAGSTILVPSSVRQTGVVANFTNYARFFSRWSRRAIQGKLADIWASQGKPSQYYIATISGYFLIATTTKFGMPGDIVSVVLDDGTFFNCIIADSKGANVAYSPHAGETGNEYGHAFGSGGKVDIIEWESNGGAQSSLKAGLQQAGWFGKKIVKMVNYGSWING